MVTGTTPGCLLVAPGRAGRPDQRGHFIRWRLCALLAIVLPMAAAAPASAPPAQIKVLRSLNWSGYALTGRGFTGVTGTFNVPVPLKPSACLEETSVWVGVDGVHNSDLLQAGVDETSFTMPSSSGNPWWPPTDPCTGQVHVYAWWEDLPSAEVRVKLPVDAGDEMTVSIFKMSPGWWALAMHDLTTGQSFLRVQPYRGPQTSVEWVVETPRVMDLSTSPVPFGAVHFRDLAAQGKLRDLERISSSSQGYPSSNPDAVASSAQLMRSGFAVNWGR